MKTITIEIDDSLHDLFVEALCQSGGYTGHVQISKNNKVEPMSPQRFAEATHTGILQRMIADHIQRKNTATVAEEAKKVVLNGTVVVKTG